MSSESLGIALLKPLLSLNINFGQLALNPVILTSAYFTGLT
jgi:hypothetical protein